MVKLDPFRWLSIHRKGEGICNNVIRSSILERANDLLEVFRFTRPQQESQRILWL